MRTRAQTLGDIAESMVADRLVAQGWIVHGRNVRIGRHELDIVGSDPGPPPALVIVEVRWRSRRDFGYAEETVDAPKRQRLRAAAFALVAGRIPESGAIAALPRLPLRFDLVAVEPGGRLRHHRGVL